MTSTTLEALRGAERKLKIGIFAMEGTGTVSALVLPARQALGILSAAIAAEEARLPLGHVYEECDGYPRHATRHCKHEGAPGAGPCSCRKLPAAHEAAKPAPLVWAVKCADGQVHRVAPRVPEQVFTGWDAEKAARLSAENAIGHCGPHTAVALAEQGYDAGLRERLRALVAELAARPGEPRALSQRLAAMLDRAPSALAPVVVLVGPGASMTREGGKIVVRCAAPTEREAALVAALRVASKSFRFMATYMRAALAEGDDETFQRGLHAGADACDKALAAYEERT